VLAGMEEDGATMRWSRPRTVGRRLHGSPRYYCASKHIQLMTASTVHVTNLTTPGVTALVGRMVEDTN
jgi:hypothetical protein